MKIRLLSELCSNIIDCPHTTPEWKNTGIPVIRNFNLRDGRLCIDKLFYVDQATYVERIKKGTPENGDLIFSREAPVGSVAMIPKDFQCCLGQRLVLLKVNANECDKNYLLYAMQSLYVKKQYLRVEKTGSIVSNFNISDLQSLKIPYPSYQKQMQIGYLCKLIDNKIALNNRLNATLEAMAKTLYDYWFVQFDFPDEKGRPYKTSGGKMVYNEELGREIPAGWEVKLIGDLLEKVSVPKGLQTSEYQSEGILPIIDQSQQFIVGYTNCTAMECLPNEAEVIVFGDHTCFFKYINFPFALGADGTQCIISNEPLRMPQLLFYYAIKDISLANKGYARHFKFLKGTSILVPAAKTAQSFQHTTEKLYGVIRKNIRETYHLAALRDWLLPMLMNGQVGFRRTNE